MSTGLGPPSPWKTAGIIQSRLEKDAISEMPVDERTK